MQKVGPLIEAGLVATCAVLDAEALYSARSPADYERLWDDVARRTSTCPPKTGIGGVPSMLNAYWPAPAGTAAPRPRSQLWSSDRI